MGGGGEGSGGTGEGTARRRRPTSDLSTLDRNSTSPCRNLLSSIFLDSLERGRSGVGAGPVGRGLAVGGAWWVGSAKPRRVSHVHTHAALTRAQSSAGPTETNPATSPALLPRRHGYSASLVVGSTAAGTRVVVALGWTRVHLSVAGRGAWRSALGPFLRSPSRGRSIAPLPPPSSLLLFASPLPLAWGPRVAPPL